MLGYSLTEKWRNDTAMYNTATALKDHLETSYYYPVFELLSPKWQTPIGLISAGHPPPQSHSPTTFCILQEVTDHIQSHPPRQFLNARFLA